jgi:hypothetical protein
VWTNTALPNLVWITALPNALNVVEREKILYYYAQRGMLPSYIMEQILRTKKDNEHISFWRVALKKQSHLTVKVSLTKAQ